MSSDNVVKGHIKNAVDRLRSKYPESVSWEDLAAFVLSIHDPPNTRDFVQELLKRNTEVNTRALKETGLFKFYPKRGIANGDDLLKYLNKSDAAAGLSASEISSVWLTKEEDILALEKKHKLLVTRNKKDGSAKHVWRNDSTIYTQLDDEFREVWLQIPLPHPDRVRAELEDVGFKVATDALRFLLRPGLIRRRRRASGGPRLRTPI